MKQHNKGQVSPGWIVIFIFIFIMAITIGIIIYNNTTVHEVRIVLQNPSSADSSSVKPPTYVSLNETYQQNTTTKPCCYPAECEGLYNKTDCDRSCIYPVYCFKLDENETIYDHFNTTNQ